MRKTPADFARIDGKLQRFFARHGHTFDAVMGVVVFAAIAVVMWFVIGWKVLVVAGVVSVTFVLWRMWVTRER